MHEPTSDTVLSHASWLRALARELTRGSGGGDADDLSQDAWVAALRQPEGAFDRPRSWWRTVVRNLQRQGSRTEARRRGREERVAEGPREAGESVVDTLERVALGRELYDTVLALDEPYRAAIFPRYYEDLAPRESAQRLDVQLATVKSRLARGLDRIRARWRERHGEEHWALVLAVFADQGSLSGGASDNLCVSDRATTLVLYKQGVGVERMSVHLEPEDLVVLRP